MIAEPAAVEQSIGSETNRCRSEFCRLFETYQPALRRLVSAYVTGEADREDLLQEIAVGIWKSLPGFRRDSSERTWVYRIAHNTAIRSASRVRKRSAREPMIPAALEPQSSDLSAEAVLLLDEQRKSMVDSIRELAVADRQLITMHLEGLTTREIEEVTGLSQGAVTTRLSRIRQRLVDRLRKEGPRHA